MVVKVVVVVKPVKVVVVNNVVVSVTESDSVLVSTSVDVLWKKG